MAYLANLRTFGLVVTRASMSGRLVRMFSSILTPGNQEKDIVTHTGQVHFSSAMIALRPSWILCTVICDGFNSGS